MAYTTGSGTYADLMNAILTHAIADGWTATNGNAWPISKGGVRGVDWSTTTFGDTDQTNNGALPVTVREIHIAVAESPAAATTQANLDRDGNATYTNAQYDIDQWHIFSDPSAGDYINVVTQFATPFYPVCFGHMGFGEINGEGMSHDPIAYAVGSPMRAYVYSPSNDNTALSYNGGCYARYSRPWTGSHIMSYSKLDSDILSLRAFTPASNSPFPLDPRWPATDTAIPTTRITDTIRHSSSAQYPTTQPQNGGEADVGIVNNAGWSEAQLYSGGVSMAPLPFMVLNGDTIESTEIMYLGSFPDVRWCSMQSYLPGDVVTLGAEEWMLFPMLRQGQRQDMNQRYYVSSGTFGFAYKKVI